MTKKKKKEHTPPAQDTSGGAALADHAQVMLAFEGFSGSEDEYAHQRAVERHAANADEAAKARLQILALALSPMLVGSSVSAPFRPMLVMQGKRSVVPEDFEDAEIDILEAMLGAAPNATVKARIADILWTRRHAGRGAFGRIAAIAYCEAAQARQHGDGWNDAANLIERAFRLTASLGRGAAAERTAVEEAVIRMTSHSREARRWEQYMALHALMREFGVGDAATWAQDCERAALAAEGPGRPSVASELYDTANSWWQRVRDNDRAIAAREASAEALVRVAEQSMRAAGAMAGAHWLELALQKLRTIPSARRKRREAELLRLLAEWQAEREEGLSVASFELDVTQLARSAESAVAGKPFILALEIFACLYSPRKEAILREYAEKSLREHPIQYLVQRIIIDENGKTIRRLPSMPLDGAEGREATLKQAMIEEANRNQDFIGTAIIEPARYTITSEHALLERGFLQIAARSPFVPAGREEWWAAGFVAGFAGDVPKSLHLLVPQLEQALRVQLRLHGVAAVSIDAAGEQEDWTLTKLLQGEGREPLGAIIGADTVFDLRALLVEKGGANIRNEMAHGLLPDGALENGIARYLFWLCFRLCMLPLIQMRRGEEAAEAAKQRRNEATQQARRRGGREPADPTRGRRRRSSGS